MNHPTSSGVMLSTTGGAAGLYREGNERETEGQKWYMKVWRITS